MSINADCAKVIKVIESCNTWRQLDNACKMADNFERMYYGKMWFEECRREIKTTKDRRWWFIE
mgnify:CR=1 FL=1